MSIIIKSTAISTDKDLHNSIKHTANAAEKCIASSKISKEDINMLINLGHYKEKNIAEPAMAALIQKNIGINLDPFSNPEGKSTFSFDLMNGESGFLHAAHVCDAMMKMGRIKHSIIVSCDVHPSEGSVNSFPFSEIGCAVLLSKSEQEGKGFKNFMFTTTDECDSSFRAYHQVSPTAGNQLRSALTIHYDKDLYIKNLKDFTLNSLKKYFDSGFANPSEIKHVIASMPVKGFGGDVARAAGIKCNTEDIFDVYGDPHTSALGVYYHVIKEKGHFKDNDHILFIGACPGLMCGIAEYVV